MPRGDKTGPKGNGPKTGRQMGDCIESNNPERTTGNFGFGRGQSRRANMNSGMGRKYRNRLIDSNVEDEQNQDLFAFLKEEVLNLKKQLADLARKD